MSTIPPLSFLVKVPFWDTRARSWRWVVTTVMSTTTALPSVGGSTAFSDLDQREQLARTEIETVAAERRAREEARETERRAAILDLPAKIGVPSLRDVLRLIQSVLIRQGQAAKAERTGGKRTSAAKPKGRRGKTVAYSPEVMELCMLAFRQGATVEEAHQHFGPATATLWKWRRKAGFVGKTPKRDEAKLREVFAKAA